MNRLKEWRLQTRDVEHEENDIEMADLAQGEPWLMPWWLTMFAFLTDVNSGGTIA